jgi:acylphosphatase
MKLRIRIVGPRVHDVGYRVFLGKIAMSLALQGLTAYNWEEEGHQEVVALVEGDPSRIAAFQKIVEERKPELAEVISITSVDFDGDVGRVADYAMTLTFEQFDKAIPILAEIRDDMKEVKQNTAVILKNTGAIIDNTNVIIENTNVIMVNTNVIMENTNVIMENTNVIIDNTGTIIENTKPIPKIVSNTDAILEEIKGLREDIQPGFASRFQQVQADVKAIKVRLGMT